MQHLKLEELARLVDETPNADERRHVEACGECRAELTALRDQTETLGRLPVAPARALDAGWRRIERGLEAEGLIRPERRAWRAGQPLRAAAAAMLFLSGSVTGGVVVGFAGARETTAPAAEQLDDPTGRLVAAEAEYLREIRQYSEIAEPGGTIDPYNRLAALEGILMTTQAALRAAPDDPVINNYHLTALGLREALIQQLGGDRDEVWF